MTTQRKNVCVLMVLLPGLFFLDVIGLVTIRDCKRDLFCQCDHLMVFWLSLTRKGEDLTFLCIPISIFRPKSSHGAHRGLWRLGAP